VADLVRRLRRQGHDIRYVDAGGGLEFRMRGAGNFEEQIARMRGCANSFARIECSFVARAWTRHCGAAGVLLARVLYRKTNRRKRFLIVDAG